MEQKNANKNDVLLAIEDLEVQYSAGGSVIHAVNGVSLEIKKGQAFGLVGETGAGKTTIAKSILRILPDVSAKINYGKIIFQGENLFEKTEKQMQKIRGKKISMVFQDPMTALNPVLTIGDQIAEVFKLHEKVTAAEATEKTAEILEMVGIPRERIWEYPYQFSGGMKQRVVIAMALACRPELLLADEPTTALDVTIQAQILEMISKLKEEQNMSLIMITHDLGIIAETCDVVGVVYAGEVIEIGTKEEIFDYPTHPYTIGLFGSIPSISGEEKRLKPIPGMPPNPSDLPEGCNFNPRCGKATKECRSNSIPLIETRPGHFCRCIHAEVKEK
ncbi:MAG: ABC transporter ATP-binding protein [Eubacteriales bacterium]